MAKTTLMKIILGTIGGIVFALGMCMALVEEWKLRGFGIGAVAVGVVLLLFLVILQIRNRPKTKREPIKKSIVMAYLIGIISAFFLGSGMAIVLREGVAQTEMIIGLICGIIGLVGCILNFPIYQYFKDKNDTKFGK